MSCNRNYILCFSFHKGRWYLNSSPLQRASGTGSTINWYPRNNTPLVLGSPGTRWGVFFGSRHFPYNLNREIPPNLRSQRCFLEGGCFFEDISRWHCCSQFPGYIFYPVIPVDYGDWCFRYPSDVSRFIPRSWGGYACPGGLHRQMLRLTWKLVSAYS